MKYTTADVLPIAYDVLAQSTHHSHSSEWGIVLDVPLSVMEKIKTRTKWQLVWYLEQKAYEYIQCAIIADVIKILSGQEVSYKMSYFQADIMEWRDVMIKIGKKVRFAADITSKYYIEERVVKSWRIERLNKRNQKNGYGKPYTSDDNVWRVVIWLPPIYNRFAQSTLREVQSIPEIHERVSAFIAKSGLSPVNTIQVEATNKNWKKPSELIKTALRLK